MPSFTGMGNKGDIDCLVFTLPWLPFCVVCDGVVLDQALSIYQLLSVYKRVVPSSLRKDETVASAMGYTVKPDSQCA